MSIKLKHSLLDQLRPDTSRQLSGDAFDSRWVWNFAVFPRDQVLLHWALEIVRRSHCSLTSKNQQQSMKQESILTSSATIVSPNFKPHESKSISSSTSSIVMTPGVAASKAEEKRFGYVRSPGVDTPTYSESHRKVSEPSSSSRLKSKLVTWSDWRNTLGIAGRLNWRSLAMDTYCRADMRRNMSGSRRSQVYVSGSGHAKMSSSTINEMGYDMLTQNVWGSKSGFVSHFDTWVDVIPWNT